jgi:hypothetical protein
MYNICRQHSGKYVLYYPEDGRRKRGISRLSFIKYIEEHTKMEVSKLCEKAQDVKNSTHLFSLCYIQKHSRPNYCHLILYVFFYKFFCLLITVSINSFSFIISRIFVLSFFYFLFFSFLICLFLKCIYNMLL